MLREVPENPVCQRNVSQEQKLIFVILEGNEGEEAGKLVIQLVSFISIFTLKGKQSVSLTEEGRAELIW